MPKKTEKSSSEAEIVTATQSREQRQKMSSAVTMKTAPTRYSSAITVCTHCRYVSHAETPQYASSTDHSVAVTR